jgi:hypothetical protein
MIIGEVLDLWETKFAVNIKKNKPSLMEIKVGFWFHLGSKDKKSEQARGGVSPCSLFSTVFFVFWNFNKMVSVRNT